MWESPWHSDDGELGCDVEDEWACDLEAECGSYGEDDWGGDGSEEFEGPEGSGDSEDSGGSDASGGSESSSEDESLNNDTNNVEVPLSWVEGGSEVAAADQEVRVDEGEVYEVQPVASPYLRLHLVGEELSDAGSTSTAGLVVLSQGWRGGLPQDLVEAVLLWLPAPALARCRVVCKAWLSLLGSPEFQQRSFFLSLSRGTPPLCAFEYSDGISEPAVPYLRAPIYKTWKLDLSFLPQVFLSEYTEIHCCSPYGLMCIGRRQDERDEMHLCVLNPVNQSFKVLPMLENYYYDGQAVLMAEASMGKVPSFKVLCFTVHQTQQMAIYSSTSGEWKALEASPDNGLELPDDRDSGLPFACDGAIYTVVETSHPRLVELSTETGSRYLWDLALPYFEERRYQERMPVDAFYLADYRGRLLCCRHGGIWRLDEAKRVWTNVAKDCPPEILPPFNSVKEHTLTLQKVQVAGDLVVFFHQVRAKGGSRVDCLVAFNMLRQCWQKISMGIGKVEGLFQAMPDLQL